MMDQYTPQWRFSRIRTGRNRLRRRRPSTSFDRKDWRRNPDRHIVRRSFVDAEIVQTSDIQPKICTSVVLLKRICTSVVLVATFEVMNPLATDNSIPSLSIP